MTDTGQHKGAIDFLGMQNSQIGNSIYKSSCKYDDKGEHVGAFLVYKDEEAIFTIPNYADLNDKPKQYLGDAIRLSQEPLIPNNPRNTEQREHLNSILAGAISQAFYGNYSISGKYIEEAEKYYKSIVSEHIRKHNCVIGIVSAAVALLALFALFFIHTYGTMMDMCHLSDAAKDWSAGIIASILGTIVSICHKSKVRLIKDKVNATWRDFIMEASIRVLFGIILAIIIIAAIKAGWISSSLLNKDSILNYLLIGFVAGFMEGKITSIANKLSNLVGIFDDDASNNTSKKNNNISNRE